MDAIISQNKLNPQIIPHKKKVLIGGCFDILHKGHFDFIRLAKNEGELLFALLESDARIKQLKGNDRPINSQLVRAKKLVSDTSCDYVILLNDKLDDADYDMIVTLIKPAIIATTKGDPYLNHKERQAKLVEGKVVEVIPRLLDYSTTNIIQKL